VPVPTALRFRVDRADLHGEKRGANPAGKGEPDVHKKKSIGFDAKEFY